jgi:hypothetical protein
MVHGFGISDCRDKNGKLNKVSELSENALVSPCIEC